MTEDEEPRTTTEEEPADEPEEEDLLKRLKYLQAEFENYKKRTAKEMEAFAEYSNQRFISMILPIVDDLKKASSTIKDEEDANGVKMIYDNLKETLRNEGLEEVGEVGDDFDPFRHECVSQVKNDELDNNKIMEVVQKGYVYRSKVLRPSKVIVVKNDAEEEGNDEDNRD
ncbi:MAG: nucleotide exchange factor GrpE [Thermoplasmata archaeon]|nr:nucleotide exchange factor GrpE [Thermoplasmata archaeon]